LGVSPPSRDVEGKEEKGGERGPDAFSKRGSNRRRGVKKKKRGKGKERDTGKPSRFLTIQIFPSPGKGKKKGWGHFSDILLGYWKENTPNQSTSAPSGKEKGGGERGEGGKKRRLCLEQPPLKGKKGGGGKKKKRKKGQGRALKTH